MNMLQVELELEQDAAALRKVVWALTLPHWVIHSLHLTRDGAAPGLDKFTVELEVRAEVFTNTATILEAKLHRLVHVRNVHIEQCAAAG
jgi:hypothetical protein